MANAVARGECCHLGQQDPPKAPAPLTTLPRRLACVKIVPPFIVVSNHDQPSPIPELFDKRGGFRKLHTFTLATIVQLETLRFCRRSITHDRREAATKFYVPKGRQYDQMVQAARSVASSCAAANPRTECSGAAPASQTAKAPAQYEAIEVPDNKVNQVNPVQIMNQAQQGPKLLPPTACSETPAVARLNIAKTASGGLGRFGSLLELAG